MNQSQIKSLYKVSEISIRYNYKVPYRDRIPVRSSEMAYEVLNYAWDKNKLELQEQFKVLLMDYRNNCLGLVDIGMGSINSCLVDSRLLFSTALKARASGIILAHNHPSGELTPSEADKKLTDNIWMGGKILDIGIFDHLIISPEGYYSFADNGILSSRPLPI
ncbi:JAB domain-containing protein [Emticicia fontis]